MTEHRKYRFLTGMMPDVTGTGMLPVLGLENKNYDYTIWDEEQMLAEQQRQLQDTAVQHRNILEALQHVSEAETEELTEKFSWKYAWRDMGNAQSRKYLCPN